MYYLFQYFFLIFLTFGVGCVSLAADVVNSLD